jgi:dynein heavy chain
LLQEVDRYNHLLLRIKRTLVDLQKGVKGLVVITTDL